MIQSLCGSDSFTSMLGTVSPVQLPMCVSSLGYILNLLSYIIRTALSRDIVVYGSEAVDVGRSYTGRLPQPGHRESPPRCAVLYCLVRHIPRTVPYGGINEKATGCRLRVRGVLDRDPGCCLFRGGESRL
jgi:hypothetical protein